MTDELDTNEIYDAIEKAVRDEYNTANEGLQIRESRLLEKEQKWAKILHHLRALPIVAGGMAIETKSLEDILKDLSDSLEEYSKLKKLMDFVQSNELLQSQWDRIVASIRLVGGDEK